MFLSINENWKIKVLALGCALILWFYVMGERRLEVGYAVPVELQNVPPGMVVTNDLPRSIDIRLSGPRALLSDLSEKDVHITVDLVGLKPGLTTFSRLDEHLRLPGGIRATRISPSFVEVKLERVVEKTVPLRARLTGELAKGYQLTAVDVFPDHVVVQGAEGELANLSEVMTERIDLPEIKGTLELNVPLDYRQKYSQIKEIKIARVRLQVEPSVRNPLPLNKPGKRKL